MFALFVLILLLASSVRSGDDYEEMQSMVDINELISSFDGMNRIGVASWIWSKENSYRQLRKSLKDVILRQITCEARSELHVEYAKNVYNNTENQIWKTEELKHQKLNCDNVKNNTFHPCLCDPSSAAEFCYHQLVKYRTKKDRRKIEKETGKLPCADRLWSKIDAFFKNFGTDYLRTVSSADIDREALLFANYTNGKLSMTDIMQGFNENDLKELKRFCVYTPKLHQILRKLGKVDIRFRIYNDLLKAKFMSMVQFNFCNKDYLLSKCMCEKESSAVFCNGFFFKHGLLTYVNETFCDDYDSVITSNTTSSLFISIVAIVLLSLHIAHCF